MPDLFSGTAGSVTVGGTVVAEIAEWGLDIGRATVDTTVFGAQWDRVIPSTKSASGIFSGNFDQGDTIQEALRVAMDAGDPVAIKLWFDSVSRYELTCLLTDEGEGVTVDGSDTTAYDFVMTGQLTYATLRYALLQDGDNILLESGDLLKWEGV